EGFDPQFGARPIRRALRRLVEDPLAEELLRNRFPEGSTVEVERTDDRLVFELATGQDGTTAAAPAGLKPEDSGSDVGAEPADTGSESGPSGA
ncbi:MAG: NDP-hexose 4-ketoreductase, partial [bacterium]